MSRRFRASGAAENDDGSSGLLSGNTTDKWKLEYGLFGINSPKVSYRERIKSDYQDRINNQYDIIWNDKEFGLWSFTKVTYIIVLVSFYSLCYCCVCFCLLNLLA